MGQKVLLADDSITVQKIVKLSLTEEGIEVIALGNGEQAVQQLETLRPDLVMADVFMPGKDGYEVCEFVKSHPQLKHIPVILLVHAFEPFDPDRAKKVGADQQLTKPFQSIRTLVTTVQDLLQASAQVEPAMQKTETVRVASMPEAGVASVSPPPPTVCQPEEEFAVVSSLASAASIQAEPEAAFAGLTMSGGVAPPAPTSFSSSAPLPLPEDSFSVPLAGLSGMSNIDLLPPAELSALPQMDWHPVNQAPPDSLQLESFSPSLTPLSLKTDPGLADNSAEDVLELSDVLLSDFGGTETEIETPRTHHFATGDMSLLAVLSAAPTTTEELAAPLPQSSEPLPSPSFRESVDIGTGQVDLCATTSPMQIQAGTMQAAQATMQIPEAVIEEIVNRVVRQLSTKAIQEVAWEVVPEMAELLIRKQISQQQHLTH